MSSLPPYLIKKLEGVLYDAFMKGIDITLFFSKEDFLEIKDYFEKITDILSRVSLKIIEIEEKTCQNVRYNDIIVNSGLILIDEAYFNSILFKDDEIFHFDGFFSSNFVEMSKKMLKIKTVKKNVKLDYPTYVNNVLETLKEKRAFKTDELSKETKIGGSKLKEILDFLVNEGKVERYSSSEGRGRPAIYYSLIENNNKK
jgi:predicted transcriptional regulator